MRSLRFVVPALLTLVVTGIPAIAQEGGTSATVSAPESIHEKATLPGAARAAGAPVAVSHQLAHAHWLDTRGDTATIPATFPELRFDGDDIEVELTFDDLTDAHLAALADAGLEGVIPYPQYDSVFGLAAPSELNGIARIPGLRVLAPNYGATTSAGSVANQADVSINADDARADFGVDGSGVTIGILSDSFDNLSGSTSGSGCTRATTGTSSQDSGDLPASVGNLEDLGSGGSDEGRGMAELIHDLAPGSPLMFATAFGGGEAGFASNITALKDCGADVIVDDVIYFREPIFQDGVVAQAAQDAVDSGVPYFSSAGNQATFGISDTFADSGLDLDGDLHDFSPGTPSGNARAVDAFAEFTLDAGEGVRFVLQWNDPFASNGLGPGASSDYNLRVLDAPSAGATVVDSSLGMQGCAGGGGVKGGDPVEVLEFLNPENSTTTFYLAISRFCDGGTPNHGDHLRVATYGLGHSITAVNSWEGHFGDAQQYGHAVAEGAVSVGAVFYHEIDSGGTTTPPSGQIDVEPFSSLGGNLPIYFDATGTLLTAKAADIRVKPEIAAPDGSNTTFFGGDTGFDADSHPNFFGTSAAAPHAAAVAALMLEHTPSHTPKSLLAAMQDTAVDIEAAGFDFLAGAGLIDAREAVGQGVVTCLGKAANIVGTPGADTLTGTAGNDVILGRGGDDVIDGGGGDDLICAGDGDDIVKGGDGNDTILGEDGADTLKGGDGDDIIKGGDGNDIIRGQKDDDTLRGQKDDDTVLGGSGDDRVLGGPGDDIVKGQPGTDTAKGQPGNDRVLGGGGDDRVLGGGGDDTVKGQGGNDTVKGQPGNDIHRGGAGNDIMRGGGGDDKLIGQGGDDRLVGQAGHDTANGGVGIDICKAETRLFCEK